MIFPFTRRGKKRAQSLSTGDRQSPLLEAHPPEMHARELLRWLQSQSSLSNVLLTSDEMRTQHIAMCQKLGWHTRPWNPVAKHLRQICSKDGRKTYDWRDVSGVQRRVRVYSISPS